MESQLTQLAGLIVWPYLITFILLTYVVKKAFGDLLAKITRFTWKPVYTVLAIATIVAIPYALAMDVKWVPMLITYCIGTSFYEIILEKIFKWVTKLFNGK